MRALVSYFLGNLFGRQLLDDEGVASLRRVLIFGFAGFAAVGLFLPRVFHKKFADLAALENPEPYRQALLADGLFVICVLLMMAAFVAALIAPAMYPDETDYVTLTPLPTPRAKIFGAKFAALAIFAGGLIAAGLVVFALSFPVFTQQRWAEYGRPSRIGAFLAASAGASAFAFFLVMAQQGLILVSLPQRWIQRSSIVAQSAAIGGLIVIAPFVFRLATRATWLASHPPELVFFPPAWFLGIEQTLLGRGDPYYANLAQTGLLAIAAVGLVALGCNVFLYRRAERLISPPPWKPAGEDSGDDRRRRPGAGPAIWVFITSTLGRDRLPQIVFLMAWAAGLAVVVNSAMGGGTLTMLRDDRIASSAFQAAVAMPLMLSLAGVAGLRAAMIMPVRLPANWVFRMMDWPESRADRLMAVERAFIRLAIAPALIVSLPVEFAVLGFWRGLAAVLMTALGGFVLLEWGLRGWRRVPFTCTWLPGKRPLPFSVLGAIAVVVVTGTSADIVARYLARSPSGLVGLGIFWLLVGGLLRWYRRRSWANLPLEFEDEPADSFQKLGLGPS